MRRRFYILIEKIDTAILEFGNSNNEILKNISQRLKEIKTRKIKFKNFKFNLIKSESNYQVDNPSHIVSAECKNVLINGDMGTGKTTFFDKLLHLFYNWELNMSPLQGLVTDITIELRNGKEEHHHIKFTSSGKARKLLVDEYNDITSLQILKDLGLIENDLVPIFFIGQRPENFLPLAEFGDNFSRFKQYFYHFTDKEILEVFKENLKNVRKTVNQNQELMVHYNNAILDLNFEIEDLSEKDKDIKFFIENFSEIQNKLQFLKNDEVLLQKVSEKKEIEREISDIKRKRIKIENLSKIEIPSAKLLKKEKPDTYHFRYDLYVNYPNRCPICANFLSFDRFYKAVDKKRCFLCRSENFQYPEYSPNVKELSGSEKDGLGSYGELDYSIQINKMQKRKAEIEKEIEEIKTKANFWKSQHDTDVLKIMSKFYRDLNRSNFSMDEEYSRQNEVFKNNKEILLMKQKQKTDFISKIETLKVRDKENQTLLNSLKKYYDAFTKQVEEELSKNFDQFKLDIEYFWAKLSADNIKSIVVKDNKLYAVTFNEKGTSRPIQINSLIHKTQKRISESQLNVLRYAIHLSLIKNFVEKYSDVPLRTIIIDDPDTKGIYRFMILLEEEFSKSLDFQIITLTSENIKDLPWKNEFFTRNEKNLKKDESTYQASLDEFLNVPLNKSELEEEE